MTREDPAFRFLVGVLGVPRLIKSSCPPASSAILPNLRARCRKEVLGRPRRASWCFEPRGRLARACAWWCPRPALLIRLGHLSEHVGALLGRCGGAPWALGQASRGCGPVAGRIWGSARAGRRGRGRGHDQGGGKAALRRARAIAMIGCLVVHFASTERGCLPGRGMIHQARACGIDPVRTFRGGQSGVKCLHFHCHVLEGNRRRGEEGTSLTLRRVEVFV